MISPYLFNIYIEELLEILEKECHLSREEILAYADDIAVICYNERKLTEVIRKIEEWSKKNGLSINKNKSAIMQMVTPRQKVELKGRTSNGREEIKGIPVVTSYKYLGLNLNNRMDTRHHLAVMAPKINYLVYRLSLAPRGGTTLRLRANMWHVFVRPLIEMCLIFDALSNKTEKKAVRALSLKTFKRICGVTQSTSTEIMKRLMGMDIEERAKEKLRLAKEKWEKRRKNEIWVGVREERKEEGVDLRVIPQSMVRVLNLLDKVECGLCRNKDRLTGRHMKDKHGIDKEEIDPAEEIRKMTGKTFTDKEIIAEREKMRRKYEALLREMIDRKLIAA